MFRRRRFFGGDAAHGGESSLQDIAWFKADSSHMDEGAWHDDQQRAVMVFLNGDAIVEPDSRGAHVVDDSFLILFNGQPGPASFTIPPSEYGERWTAVLDTDGQVDPGDTADPGEELTLARHSIAVLTRPPKKTVPVASGSGAVSRAARESARVASPADTATAGDGSTEAGSGTPSERRRRTPRARPST